MHAAGYVIMDHVILALFVVNSLRTKKIELKNRHVFPFSFGAEEGV